MRPTTNRRIVLAARPKGEPKDSDFRLEEAEVPSPGEGQVLLKTLYLSLDPYMRGRMSDAPSYAKPVQIGEVMEGGTVSEVVESRSPDLKPGDVIPCDFDGEVTLFAEGVPVLRGGYGLSRGQQAVKVSQRVMRRKPPILSNVVVGKS